VDPAAARVEVPVPHFSFGGGLVQPGGMAIGPDGYLYVASYSPGSVPRYEAETGALVDAFVTSSAGAAWALDLAFDDGGDLYLSTGTSTFRATTALASRAMTAPPVPPWGSW